MASGRRSVMAGLAAGPVAGWPRAGRPATGRTRPGTVAARRPAAGGRDICIGQVATPRLRQRRATSMTAMAAAAPNTMMRAAVRMVLAKVTAMLTAPATPSTATAVPSPLELAPQPQHADPGLHMRGPFRAGGRRSYHDLPTVGRRQRERPRWPAGRGRA